MMNRTVMLTRKRPNLFSSVRHQLFSTCIANLSVPRCHGFAIATCLPLKGCQAFEVVKANKRRQHLRYLEHIDNRCGHALA